MTRSAKASPLLTARIAGVFYLLTFVTGIFALFARGSLGVTAGLIAAACYIVVTLLLGVDNMKTIGWILVLLLVIEVPVALAIDSKGASYFGGTLNSFNGAKDPVEGRIDTSNEKSFIFYATDKHFSGKTFSIPYDRVLDLEYGQKAGRRSRDGGSHNCTAWPDWAAVAILQKAQTLSDNRLQRRVR